MAGKADILAGQAYVRLFLKDDMTSNLKRAFGGITAVVGPALAGIAAVTAASIKEFSDFGSAINDMRGRTGASAKQLQEWTFAANQTGASAEDLEKAIRSAAKNGVGPGEFERVGKEIASIADPAQRSAAAMEMFGRSGTKLIPMFSDLNSLKAASQALGPILTDAEVARADKLGDSLSAAAEAWKRAMNQIGDSASPLAQAFAEMKAGAALTAGQAAKSSKGMNVDWMFPSLSGWGLLRSAGKRALGAAAVDKAGTTDEEAVTSRMLERSKALSAIQKNISDEFAKRNSMLREFMTPYERYVEKEKELRAAINQAVNAGASGLFSPDKARAQVTQLHIALARLKAEEMDRLKSGMPAERMKAAKPDLNIPSVEFKNFSASTAFGALALANGTGKGQSTMMAEHAKDRKVLERLIKIQEEMLRKTGKQVIAT